MNETPLIDQDIAGRLELHEAFVQAFGTTHGEAVLAHLFKTFVMRESFRPNDPYTTAFNEGRRSLVMAIFREVNRDVFELYKLMEKARR